MDEIEETVIGASGATPGIRGTQIDGDVSVGRNVSIGGKATVAGSVNVGHNLKVEGWLEAPNIKDINKGLFATSTALAEAYPSPEVGWFALVGSSTPWAIWGCTTRGTWTDTGGTSQFPDIELNIVNDLTTGGATNVLSAEQGKILRDNLMLIYDALSEGAFWQGKPTLSWAAGNSFQVINNLDGVTNSNIATTIAKNGTYSATLTSSGDFDVTITMGGTDVTSLVYNDSTGAISIAEVTGALVITAVMEVEPQIEIYDGYAIDTDGSMVASSGKSCTDFIPMEACKLVWSAGALGTTSSRFNLVIYNEQKEYIEYYNSNANYRIIDLTTHAQASNIAYVRITFATSKVSTRICYDITNGAYIFKGEDYDGRYDNLLWGKYSSPQSGATQDNILSSDDWAITDFVAIPSNCGSVTNKVGSSATGHKSTYYDANKVYKVYYDNSSDPRTITDARLGADWKYEKISVYLDKLDDCYIKDATNNTYLWNGFNID